MRDDIFAEISGMAKRIAERKKLQDDVEGFFENGFAKNWFFKIPAAFADQMDIARTSKGATMGNCFSFEGGDIFYDDESVYEVNWAGALKKIKYAIAVNDATPSSLLSEDETFAGGSAKKQKYVLDGIVKFSLFRQANENGLDMSKPELFEVSQFEFAEILRNGVDNFCVSDR